GLGGLILLNLLEKVDLKVEGVLLISPLVAFQQNISTRRNFLASSFGTVAKDAKFDTGIKVESLTRNKEVIDDTNKDALMLNKVSYHWYKTILETMKATMENIHHISPIPTLLMLGTEDKIVDTESIRQIGKTINTNELYFKAWHGLNHEVHNEPERENVMKYIISFMNNRIHYVGLLIDDETE
ncbi:alpha/beta hydrolase, partial [Mammaliicoccus sciuri]